MRERWESECEGDDGGGEEMVMIIMMEGGGDETEKVRVIKREWGFNSRLIAPTFSSFSSLKHCRFV